LLFGASLEFDGWRFGASDSLRLSGGTVMVIGFVVMAL